jgi:hypothetical protein
MDGDGDEVLRGRLGMELGLAGTVGDGDRCSSPCSSLVQTDDNPTHQLEKSCIILNATLVGT